MINSLPNSALPQPNMATQTPSDIRYVTQSQETLSMQETIRSAPKHQHVLNALCTTEHTENTPQWNSLADTPIIPSPDCVIVVDCVAACLFTDGESTKQRSDSARNNGAVKAMKKCSYSDPSNNLL